MPDLAPELAARLAIRFRSLGDPLRLRILYALMGGERRVSDLVESTAGNQANVSKHLQLLQIHGMVTRRKEGTSVYYTIADPVVFGLCELMCGSLGATPPALTGPRLRAPGATIPARRRR